MIKGENRNTCGGSRTIQVFPSCGEVLRYHQGQCVHFGFLENVQAVCVFIPYGNPVQYYDGYRYRLQLGQNNIKEGLRHPAAVNSTGFIKGRRDSPDEVGKEVNGHGGARTRMTRG